MRLGLKMKTCDELLHIDVHVDESEARTSVLDLLRMLRPHWRPQDIRMKTFTEGITNRLLGCSVDESDCVLVRVYGQQTELFVDRQREVEMFRLLHAHGRGPQIYCSFRNGICYQFVPGDVLEDRLLCQPSIYKLIAAEMARIHSICPPNAHPPERLLWTKMSHFLTLLEDSGKLSEPSSSSGPQLPSLAMLSAEAESLERHLSPLGSPTVLCHNDLLTKNIIHDREQGRVSFIDYEYAEYNYQAFDIGNHFNEFAGVQDIDYSRWPSRRLQSDWLEAYLFTYKHCTGQDVSVTRDEASNFFWGLWAILQSHYSSIDFDFHSAATTNAVCSRVAPKSMHGRVGLPSFKAELLPSTMRSGRTEWYAVARLNRYFEKKEEYFFMK